MRSSTRACGPGSTSRNSDEVGAAIGRRVARWQERRFPQAGDDDNDHDHGGNHDRHHDDRS
jgi:hypothetical protein